MSLVVYAKDLFLFATKSAHLIRWREGAGRLLLGNILYVGNIWCLILNYGGPRFSINIHSLVLLSDSRHPGLIPSTLVASK